MSQVVPTESLGKALPQFIGLALRGSAKEAKGIVAGAVAVETSQR